MISHLVNLQPVQLANKPMESNLDSKTNNLVKEFNSILFSHPKFRKKDLVFRAEVILNQLTPQTESSLLSEKVDTLLINLAKVGRPLSLVYLFKKKGADFNYQEGKMGNTALLWAIANANSTFALEFIDVAKNCPNINWDLKDNKFGNTALILAVMKGYYETTTCGQALKFPFIEIVRALLEAGADVNAQDNLGNTALHYAVLKRDILMVRLLLEYGANREALSIECIKPIDLLEIEYEEAKEILSYRTCFNPDFQLFYIAAEEEFEASKDALLKLINN